MAATYRTSAAGGGTTGTANRTITITPAVGDLLVVFVSLSGNTNTAPTMTDDNGSGTYTLVAQALRNSSADNMAVFIRNTLMVNTTSTVITCASGANTAAEFVCVMVSGMTRTGNTDAVKRVGGVVQVGVQANQAATGTPAPALPANANSANMILSCVANGTTGGSVVVPATNHLERQDVSQANPTTGLEVNTRDSGFTGPTLTYGGTSATAFSSAVLELDPSPPYSVVSWIW